MWQIVGHERVVSLLKLSLEKGTLSHAYLFTGPPHVGKMTLAIDLARALNCEGMPAPCGECQSCRKIAEGKHADVQVIGLAEGKNRDKPQKEISIEQVREIQRQVSLPPFEGRRKVFIIDGAERLSSEAANCLLKTLEEPVSRVVFILLTKDERLLPPTVISRCQHLRLFPMPMSKVASVVSSRSGVTPEKAKLLAHLSRGSPGWALSAAQDDGLLQVRTDRAEKALGLVSANYEVRFGYAVELAAQFGRESEKVREILDEWRGLWRDLLLIKLDLNQTITNIDLELKLVNIAKGSGIKEIVNFIRDIEKAKAELVQNVSPRLVFEVLMLSMSRWEGA